MNGTERRKLLTIEIRRSNLSDSEKMAAFFKADKRFDRIMKELLKKYEKYGEAKGTITINNASLNECEAANSIINPKNAFDPPILRFKTAAFERGIKASRYKNSDLKSVLEAYFNTVIIANKDKKLIKEQAKKEFLNSIILDHNNTSSLKWLIAMSDECKYGYIIIIREFEESDLNARNMLDNICRAVDSRFENYDEPIQLAVLSANITGNSHYFDGNTVAGKLLIHALAYLAEINNYKNAEEIKAVYSEYSIEPDSISCAAVTIGVRLFYGDKREHPAFKAFADLGDICLISSSNLIGIEYASSDRNRVYIVENQMVFTALADTAKECRLSLICTSGQLKTAALKLIDMLIQDECNVFYAGDFDPEGLQIADKLCQRYENNERFHIWRMSCQDYISIEKSEDEISEQRLKKLSNIRSPLLAQTAGEICSVKRPAYQELLIKKMIEDMKSSILMTI